MSAVAGGRQRPLLGIALIVLMSACFAAMDNASRYLGRLMPVLVFFWSRYLFQAVSMALWLGWRHGRAGFATVHPRFQGVRGVLLVSTSAFSFYGVQHMPVPEFTAIIMLTPLLVLVLAGWWLKEPVGRTGALLVLGGFTGALIIIRPGSGLFGWAVLFPVAGTLTYACFQVLTRRLSGSESPTTTHFYTGLIGTAVLTPCLWLFDVPVADTLRGAGTGAIGVLLAIGALGTVGHLLLIVALGLAPTATLMPFVYTQIGFATVVGWWLFRQVPDHWAGVGMGVIAACGAAGAWLSLRRLPSVDPVTVDVGD